MKYFPNLALTKRSVNKGGPAGGEVVTQERERDGSARHNTDAEQGALLKSLPAVDALLRREDVAALVARYARTRVVEALRQALQEARDRLWGGQPGGADAAALVRRTGEILAAVSQGSLRRVLNATGVIVHTNLGRAVLSTRARAAVRRVAAGYSNLEYDLASGERGSRYQHVAGLLCTLTGAEAALVVNNNAAAVLLALHTLARGRQVVISRGQLVEIGGSFRIPEVMAASGVTLVEVGTTNKTHPADYEQALTAETAALLKVHTSNYRIIGFTAQVDTSALAALARQHALPLLVDLGSGALSPLPHGQEPTVQQELAAGADVVMFSGDKLLGAGQAGIIVGRRRLIAAMQHDHLLRALRVDKLSLAALEGTLLDYLIGVPERDIPVVRMMSTPPEVLEDRAERLEELLQQAGMAARGWRLAVVPATGQAGGGSLPGVELPGWAVAMEPPDRSVQTLAAALRQGEPPVLARLHEGRLLLDVRCLQDRELPRLAAAVAAAARQGEQS